MIIKHGGPVIRRISDPEIHDVPSVGTRLIILKYFVIEWSFDGRLKYLSVGLLFPPKLTEADCPHYNIGGTGACNLTDEGDSVPCIGYDRCMSLTAWRRE